MSNEEYTVASTGGVSFTDRGDESIIFYIKDTERLRLAPDGFYVEGRLVANDTQIYEAFKAFLNGTKVTPRDETQDDRYYKAIRRHIKGE
jgi:hypothetical protein